MKWSILKGVIMMKLRIIGMTCVHCEIFIKKVLSNVPRVTRVLGVNRDRSEAIIEGQPDPQVLVGAVRKYDYDVELENVQHV
jgi:copper chaperone CopZ